MAKKKFYEYEFNKYRNDIRQTWKTIKTIINKTKQKEDFPKHFLVNNQSISNPVDIANKFNEYFVQIGPTLANCIDTSGKALFNTYLKNKSTHSFKFNYTSPSEIHKLIKKLPPKTSSGHDNLSLKLLKEIGQNISDSLSLVINQSLKTGIFPEKLKLAKLIPLYKKGDASLFGNYRPISLLPSISKIFEKVVYMQVYSYFKINKLFFGSQYGFRDEHSTELASLEFVDKTLKQLDKGEIPIAIFLDLSKAFDTLNHDILLHKLQHYGIGNTPLNGFLAT